MSAGMADIIAAHPGSRYGIYTTGGWWIGCEGCDWHEAIGPSPIETYSVGRHHAHVAEELAKAGYGNVQEALVAAADAMPIETLEGADKASVWLRQRAMSIKEDA